MHTKHNGKLFSIRSMVFTGSWMAHNLAWRALFYPNFSQVVNLALKRTSAIGWNISTEPLLITPLNNSEQLASFTSSLQNSHRTCRWERELVCVDAAILRGKLLCWGCKGSMPCRSLGLLLLHRIVNLLQMHPSGIDPVCEHVTMRRLPLAFTCCSKLDRGIPVVERDDVFICKQRSNPTQA